MKGVLVCVDTLGETQAAARLVDGRLDDLLIDPAPTRPRIGTVFRGTAQRPLKGLGAWLVDLPGSQTGFLKGGKGLRPGDRVVVQVTGLAEAGKAVPVTTRLLIKSRHAIATPGAPGINIARAIDDADERARLSRLATEAAAASGSAPETGVIVRSAAAGADNGAIAEDVARVLASASAVAAAPAGGPETLLEGPSPPDVADQEWPAPADMVRDAAKGSFERAGIAGALDALRGPEETLDGAGHLFVESTRACVTVDVNTGADTSPAAGLKANLAAARGLPRALRLRGLAGQIVIDCAPMGKRDRPRFEQALRSAFARDPIETTLIGWTSLGLFELTRKRERVPLAEVLG